MPEYIDKEKYCAEVCKCNKEKCDKSKCPIWNAPAADVAPVVHAKRVKTKKHNWKKDIDGKIDLYAWGEGYCEGPFCLECGRSFCIHCEEVHRGKDAVEAKLNEETCYERTVCSVCGRPISEDAQYCNCGAKMDLKEDK